jgi:hypothetical protein
MGGEKVGPAIVNLTFGWNTWEQCEFVIVIIYCWQLRYTKAIYDDAAILRATPLFAGSFAFQHRQQMFFNLFCLIDSGIMSDVVRHSSTMFPSHSEIRHAAL